MVELKNVSGSYGEKEVLHNIDVSFKTGEVTVIVGPNGCGKSTLLKSVIGLVPHISGEIMVEGKKIEEMESVQLARKVAYLPQNKLPADVSVMRMVLHGRFPYLSYPRRYREEDIEIAKNALEWLGIAHLAEKKVNQLSGGTQQKVYIAMAFAQNTSAIFMDEPTVYLDISHQMKLLGMAGDLASKGKAVVMVLHDLTQAFRTADKIVVMADGKIVMHDTAENVFNSGIVKQIFGITMERTKTKNGWQYFYDGL